ncbi:DUF1189 domain-containing protein [Bacillus tuaregi]|uniref:DUF1189 domain-containing protein n=1 Tax=Bacillus tuaregi TaxID=1816695 RepID=UPI0008F8D674|nr:DUF1189 domain-containing protein [Bacillus tuaregi]
MNIFKQLIVSLYSPRNIAGFRQQGTGKTIFYVFFLTLLSVLPSIYYFSTSMMAGFNAVEDTITSEIPSFTIENGELVVEENAPITIKSGDLTVVFDGTGTLDQADVSRSDNTIFFLKNEITYTITGQTQSFPYSMLGDTAVTKEDLLSIINSLDSLLPVMLPITLIIIYLFSTAMKFIEVTILALIGLALKNLAGKPLRYGQLFRLAAYSITLPTIFFIIMDSLQTVVPSGFFIHWFVAIMMLMLSIKEVQSDSTEGKTDM